MTHDRLSLAALDTPIGRLWVAVSPRGVVAVSRGSTPSLGAPDSVDAGAAGAAVAELEAYFAGRVRAFDARLDLTDAGPFDVAVWTAVRSIPFGTTASYGEVAIMAGRPGAARAVGRSMARCPLFPLVPCHRVIAADGSLGGWSGDPSVKRWLLAFESRAAPGSVLAQRLGGAQAAVGAAPHAGRAATSSSAPLRRPSRPAGRSRPRPGPC